MNSIGKSSINQVTQKIVRNLQKRAISPQHVIKHADDGSSNAGPKLKQTCSKNKERQTIFQRSQTHSNIQNDDSVEEVTNGLFYNRNIALNLKKKTLPKGNSATVKNLSGYDRLYKSSLSQNYVVES